MTGRAVSRSARNRTDAPAATQPRRAKILDAAASLIATSGLRTSMHEIADAAGILQGSLYHHFDSKEAILMELIQRYHTDLDHLGEVAEHRLEDLHGDEVEPAIVELASAIAACAVRHRAALQLSFYEEPSNDPEMVRLVRRRPEVLQQSMIAILRVGRRSGRLRSDVDLAPLAERICQTMLYAGLDPIRHNATPDQMSHVLSRILLHGLAVDEVSDSALDSSAAFEAADRIVQTWEAEPPLDPDDRVSVVRAAARAEFGRRGYEITTVRDIAAAIGLGTATVYRVIGTKDELLMTIMQSFGKKVASGWSSVLRSESTPLEKLDAISWVNVNAMLQFTDEFRIQLAWLRQSPPDTPNPGWSFSTRLRQMKALLAAGIRAGELRVHTTSSLDLLTRCVIGIQWMPETIVRHEGERRALMHTRDTVLRGIAQRR